MKAIEFQITPILPPSEDQGLIDLTLALTQKAGELRGRLHSNVQLAIGDLVRSMNCYYSNFLEGHETHPESIEQAIHSDSADNPQQSSRQTLAKAHIDLQRLIDERKDPSAWPTSVEYLKWLHEVFCSHIPDEMLWVTDPATNRRVRVEPGQWRLDTVRVGRHIPPAPNELDRLMQSFEQAYAPQSLSKFQQIASAAAAHHRLVWIHPFVDGNGRVARLMSHALLLRLDVGSTLWSVSRGLARDAESYLSHLASADSVRRGDLDGRGYLSERGLQDFCRFFLGICCDQVQFMINLLQPDEILRRIRLFIDDEVEARRLPKRSFALMREAFIAGEVARGKAPELTGYEERRARETLSSLLERGLLVPQGFRAPVRLGIPIDVVERWFPGLYPTGMPNTPDRRRQYTTNKKDFLDELHR